MHRHALVNAVTCKNERFENSAEPFRWFYSISSALIAQLIVNRRSPKHNNYVRAKTMSLPPCAILAVPFIVNAIVCAEQRFKWMLMATTTMAAAPSEPYDSVNYGTYTIRSNDFKNCPRQSEGESEKRRVYIENAIAYVRLKHERDIFAAKRRKISEEWTHQRRFSLFILFSVDWSWHPQHGQKRKEGKVETKRQRYNTLITMCAIILAFSIRERLNLYILQSRQNHTRHSLLWLGLPHFEEHDFSTFILCNHCLYLLLLLLLPLLFHFAVSSSVRWIDTNWTQWLLSLTRAHAHSHSTITIHGTGKRTVCSGIQFNAYRVEVVSAVHWATMASIHPSNRQNWYDLHHTFPPLFIAVWAAQKFYIIHGWLRNRWTIRAPDITSCNGYRFSYELKQKQNVQWNGIHYKRIMESLQLYSFASIPHKSTAGPAARSIRGRRRR